MPSSSRSRRSHLLAAVAQVESLDRRVLLSATSATKASAPELGSVPAWMANQFSPAGVSFTRSGSFLTGKNATKRGVSNIGVDFLRSASVRAGLTASAIESPFITSSYTDDLSAGGMTHTYLQQEFNGLPVLNTSANVSVDRQGRVLAASTRFVSATTAENGVRGITLSAADALRAAAGDLGIALSRGVKLVRQFSASDRVSIIAAPDYQTAPISAGLSYVAQAGGKMELVWHTILDLPDHSHWYDLGISASTGKILFANDYVEHATYNVFPLPTRSPQDGGRTILTDPQDATASPYGWHDTNGVAGADYTITRGNNVWAGIDRDGTNGVDPAGSPDGGASLNFNQTLDLAQAPTLASNQQAAVTNLFYLNNAIHDITYGYGFNEASGNFQANNYGHGGAANDAVSAEAQDSSGTNNANFATPADGTAPRMQMYIFDRTSPNRDGDLDATVVLHEYTHGISNRLTGGPADANSLENLQSSGMGEGWSDWMALMLTMKPSDTATTQRTIGTYLYGQASTGAGFRRKPYTTDMSVNNQTIDLYNLNASFPEPHDAGELWCDALWDMSWNLIGRYGMSTNLYGGWSAGQAGNKLAIQLVINGMKLQPSNPTFAEARDAILQADVNLTGGVNADLIWQAFARRGMGLSFDTGSTSNATIVKGAFDAPGQISGKVYNDENDNNIIDADEVGLAGASVYVDANNNSNFDAGEAFGTTDTTGFYKINGLPAGTYTVRAYKAGTQSAGSQPAVYTVAVTAPGVVNVGRDFALTSQARVSGVAYNDTNGNGVKDAGESGLSGVRVFADENANGTLDTSTLDQSQSPALAIPETNSPVYSNLVVSGALGVVNTIGVRVDISHTFDFDLTIALISPKGTRIVLAENKGGGSHGLNLTFLDSATSGVNAWPGSSAGPITGTWKPQFALATLNGQQLNGTWKLEVSDIGAPDSGILNSWSIFQTTTERSTLTAADGSYTIRNLPAGVYGIVQQKVAGTAFSSPPSGIASIVAAAGSATAIDFGTVNATFAGTTGDDIFYIRSNPGHTRLQIFANAAGTGTPLYDVDRATFSATSLTISGGNGNDTFYLDYANGDPAPAAGLSLDLGAGSSDRINVYGTSGAEQFNFQASSITANVIVSGHESIGFDGKLGGDQLILTSGPTVQLLATQELASLSVSSGQTLDLQTFGVIDKLGTEQDALTNAAKAALGGGAGIGSTWVATNRGSRVVGIASSAALSAAGGSFMGIPVNATSVLIRPTLKGDFNLNGVVNFDDLIILAQHYNQFTSAYENGNANYDNQVNFDDLISLAQNYNQTAAFAVAAQPPLGSAASSSRKKSAPVSVLN